MGDASVVAIEPCVREPCSLKKKSNVTVKITFTPSMYIVIHLIEDAPF